MIELLLDGDWVVYTSGFAGQKTELAWFPDNELIPPVIRPSQTEIKNVIRPYGYTLDEGALFSRTIVDPLDHVLHTAKNMIKTQVEETQKKFKDDVHLTIYVDGDGNFRSRLATIRPYKGNRSANKPVLFNEIRQYLIEAWDARVIFGQESDDEMAIDATNLIADGETPVICAVDKDMLQVPGIHRNPNKGWRKVSKQGGQTFLYRQCITGDAVDNIAGCYKAGAKAAEKIIKPEMSEEEMWNAVVGAYEASVLKYGDDLYNGLGPEAAALENMRLVYLRRTDDEIWVPPHKR